ncbi:MAG: hypothetical protein HOM34_06630 [Planctomycetes bacterium]|jgi:anti-sigma factor RsiW|nr:hypothetical protein [Planctomycetota bacterium]MBT4028734.1 hypothetical protein [Planctomycetota bacterium]MBT4560222.1 hypothetical protein [Planctomycetota bacterium]MBT5100353.1 hypothetical protein [Planctomycetota bacterium]MBT5120381.1 hypothetical protein [Planctomycetota bacterium]
MMEEKIFPLAAVAAELDFFVEARLHTDGADAEKVAKYKAMQLEMANSYANPIYVVVDPQSGDVVGLQQGAEMDPTKFASWLQSLRHAAVANRVAAANDSLKALEAIQDEF